jgi:hypothetical protein
MIELKWVITLIAYGLAVFYALWVSSKREK